ncbi:helix-turn-helix domain-containing protein [Methylophilaceae bacterium]|jgi:cytoskeletal protein RodZ|nr:helix-turn-helix domain-containing protein [Methylophilaceae bacterium]|tara:strand:+ start:676 stop:1584 length:909 start_codon:yes stop_codon:yes gene_type:complete
MVDINNTLEYNYKILSQERKKQKISQENAAAELTLSVTQINSLENNLEPGFITPHFKKIALKRYAKFLGVDFDKIIPLIPPEFSLDVVSKEKMSIAETEDDHFLNSLHKLTLKVSRRSVLLALIILGLVFIIFFIQPNKDTAPNSKIAITNVDNSKVAPIDDSIAIPISKNYIKDKNLEVVSKKEIQEIDKKSDISSTEFLCTIESASMDKIWSHANPEKPATYFHIVSLKKQSICTIDNQGILKQYDLVEGGKITHRGQAPFKIQLDSSISELYFQGWKVILKDNDNFIQLTPVDMAAELN